MTTKFRIVLISQDKVLSDVMELRLQGKGYQVVTLAHFSEVLGIIYSDPPDIIIIDLTTLNPENRTVIKGLKDEGYFSLIPVIGLLQGSQEETIAWDQYPIDDFLNLPLRYSELFTRITLSIHRIQRVFDHNPLTKLPGNISIQRAVERAIGKAMGVCYLDINNFKPYNDTYGFARGDEVIRMVARIISNAVKEAGGEGFSGHIGGDDFVFIVPMDLAEPICKTILNNFNTIVSDLFGEQEKAKGHYMAKDRKGQEKEFPLLGIAIAIVPTFGSKIEHYGKIAEVAAELKCYAKKSSESRYVIDRRGD